MNTKFKTVKQLLSYVKKAKQKADKLKLKYPEYSFSSMSFNDLSLDLIYKLDDFVNGDKKNNSFSNPEKLEHKNNRLTLYAFSKFDLICSFYSIEVEKDCDCVERKEFKPKQVKETA